MVGVHIANRTGLYQTAGEKKRVMTQMKKQSELSKEVARSMRWKSHLPVIRSFLQMPVANVMELGAGMNSTEEFAKWEGHRHSAKFVSIESDMDWIKFVKENIDVDIKWYETPSHITRSTFKEKISENERHKYVRFCESNMDFVSNSMLFIDCYAGYRLAALESLYHKFNIVLFHDYEVKEDKCYGYSEFKCPRGWVLMRDKTWLSHTGILVHEDSWETWNSFIMEKYAVEAKVFAKEFDCEYAVNWEVVS